MKKPSDEDNSPTLLQCQDCGAVTPWDDWLDPEAFELCPKCGSHSAKLMQPEPPPLPELTDDEKARSLYLVPFPEGFGKERIEILLTCRQCSAASTYGMRSQRVYALR
jgi:hypothetical protein